MTSPILYAIPVRPPGRLSTMARPDGGERLDSGMSALRAHGVDVLVCLLGARELRRLGLLDEPAAAARAGIEFHHLPVRDFGVPEPAAAAVLVDALTRRLAEGRHVAIHCRGGIGRSSTLAACVLTRQGLDAEDAWNTVGHARGVRVPETRRQRRWLASYLDSARRTNPPSPRLT